MEAPKIVQHFENIDAKVDSINHNHPGLQAPIYREDSHRELILDEDDIEDSADGQIPNDYQDNKVRSIEIYKFRTRYCNYVLNSRLLINDTIT